MVTVRFIVGGREVTVSEDTGQRPANAVDRVMLLAARKHVHRRLGEMLCAQHGERPSVVATGPSPDRLQFSVEGCCDALVARASRALEALPP